MISVVVYGRNDSYGYNLHKRATVSLNCLAEKMTAPDDEIIFVDYNSETDFPTFPEAVSDLLTTKCKRLLRIIRVRPHIHRELFGNKTHLKTLEPIARNVGIIRMNRSNRWVLSTNTDMIILTKSSGSISETVAGFECGNYSVPRFEIPESVWETFDRLNPKGIIKTLPSIAQDLHLKETVTGDPWNLFDAPGDFQLFTSNDIFKINGFDEKMYLGWHCDSNLNKRLWLVNGETKDASTVLEAYHCDHTRQITPMHKSGSAQNDMHEFVFDLKEPKANKGMPWGLADHKLEEIRIEKNSQISVLNAFNKGLKSLKFEETKSEYTSNSFEKNRFPRAHVITFIADHILPLGENIRVGWIGSEDKIKVHIGAILNKAGVEADFVEISQNIDLSSLDVVIVENSLVRGYSEIENSKLFEKVLKFSFGGENIPAYTKFIFTDVMQTRFESLIRKHFDCSKTPYSARILSGYPQPSSYKEYTRSKGVFARSSKRLTYFDIIWLALFNNTFLMFVQRSRIWLLQNREAKPIVFKISRLAFKVAKKTRLLRW